MLIMADRYKFVHDDSAAAFAYYKAAVDAADTRRHYGTNVWLMAEALGRLSRAEAEGYGLQGYEYNYLTSSDGPHLSELASNTGCLRLMSHASRYGDLDEAARLFREAIALHPLGEAHAVSAVYNLGLLAAARDDLEGAVRQVQRAAEIVSTPGHTHDEFRAGLYARTLATLRELRAAGSALPPASQGGDPDEDGRGAVSDALKRLAQVHMGCDCILLRFGGGKLVGDAGGEG